MFSLIYLLKTIHFKKLALAEQQAGPALLITILLHAFLNGPETSVFKTHSLPCTKQAAPHRHGFLCERLGPQGGTTVRWWICCQTFRDNCPSSISPSRPGSATYAMCQLKRAALMKERGRRAGECQEEFGDSSSSGTDDERESGYKGTGCLQS